ncbi:hypothetical protein DXG01_008269 [Tephrocybe rancida]|nr:hypothetical protein DXG01_008269 [Tephrocybe rancida]
MASLEPPSRSYVAMDGPQAESAKSSITHFEMAEASNSSRIVDALDLVSHELPQEEEAGEKPDASETAPGETPVPQTPQVYLTFLVISGRRRTMSFEPGTTLGRVKELVWNSWPSEWEDERPTAPSYLRVLYLGRMLQDDDTLSKLNFPTHIPQSNPAPTPTIVHLSIRPFAPQGETELKKKRRNRQSDVPPTAAGTPGDEPGDAGCCGCVSRHRITNVPGAQPYHPSLAPKIYAPVLPDFQYQRPQKYCSLPLRALSRFPLVGLADDVTTSRGQTLYTPGRVSTTPIFH